MTMTTKFVARVSKSGTGVLSAYAPITLKNVIREIRSIEDIGDIDEIDVTSGATLVYNSEKDKYEIRKLMSQDLPSISSDLGLELN